MMTSKEKRVLNSSTISVKNLLFQVFPNKLLVSDGVNVLETSVKKEDLEILESFISASKQVTSPIYSVEVIHSIDNGLQKITVLRDTNNTYTLIINDQIQFTTDSEIIYHEALVSPAIASSETQPTTFLILGGGDGLAAKQIFKECPEAKITLVDFDKDITDIFTYDSDITKFNENSLKKCTVINADAFEYIKHDKNKYDVIICDFPDPDDVIFNKLYSLEFYLNLKKLLNPNGKLSVQSGSLVDDSKCFICIVNTLQSAGFKTLKYYTPTSYGELVYSLCSLEEVPVPVFRNKLKTITNDFFNKAMTTFRPNSLSEEDIIINTYENLAAYAYRRSELDKYEED
jgi:spermidine synthase